MRPREASFYIVFSCFFARAREDSPESLYPCGFAAILAFREFRLFPSSFRLFPSLSVFFRVLSTFRHRTYLTELMFSVVKCF